MNKIILKIGLSLFLSVVLVVSGVQTIKAQYPGHLFLLKDNMYSFMVNPSLMSNHKGLIIGVPGFSGTSFWNYSNLKLADLVDRGPENGPVIDLMRLYNRADDQNYLAPGISTPLLFAGIPVKNGMWSFYVRENLMTSVHFPREAFLWFENGNVQSDFRNYQSGPISAIQLGYLEAAAGLTFSVGTRVTWGVRGKILVGRSYVNLKNWDFGIRTMDDGSEVTFLAKGEGSFSLPYDVLKYENNRIYRFETSNATGRYFSEFSNPGIAIDAAFTGYVGMNSLISIGINDAGIIWFRKGTYDIPHDEAYRFKGMDLSDVLGSGEGKSSVSPFELMMNTKDSLKNVFRPVGTSIRHFQPVIPKMFVHFRHELTHTLSLGITNQTLFFRTQPVNILTGSIGITKGNLSFAGGPALYGFNQINAGAGFQWNYRIIQLFVMTDNLLAFYHPGNQSSYSLTFGMNMLFGADPGQNKSSRYRSRGIILPHRPFYRQKR